MDSLRSYREICVGLEPPPTPERYHALEVVFKLIRWSFEEVDDLVGMCSVNTDNRSTRRIGLDQLRSFVNPFSNEEKEHRIPLNTPLDDSYLFFDVVKPSSDALLMGSALLRLRDIRPGGEPIVKELDVTSPSGISIGKVCVMVALQRVEGRPMPADD